ncbi:MAG: DUF2330 domain-containing protein [Patescibacteria group bacterium]|nr:DUF2330 domain-containing protein [Patescibacteria group bacterium]
MKKLFKTAFFILTASLMLPSIALADGMIVPPPDYYMYETDQKAAIFYEDGTETLVLSTAFQGDARDFAWLVPTPNKPEISKSSDELFTSLEELTQITNYSQRLDYPIGSIEDTKEGGINVIETKKVDYYEVTTLQAEDADELLEWFDDNDYYYPSLGERILEDYVNESWYFVAMKINAEELSDQVGQELKTGHATPVKIVFKSDKIIYPLKISGAMNYYSDDSQIIYRDEPTPESGITEDAQIATNPRYLTGKSGQAIRLGKGDQLIVPIMGNFNASAGTMALWVKGLDFSDGATYQEFVNVVGSESNDIMEFRSQGRKIEFADYSESGQATIWQSFIDSDTTSTGWHQVAVTWAENQKPQIYFDGQALATRDRNNIKEVLVAGDINPTTSGTIYFGQRGIYLDEYPLGGGMDELAIFNSALTTEQIAASYSLGSNEQLDSLLWSASFENNLNLTRRDGQIELLVYNRTTSGWTTYEPPATVTLTLYVISGHKQSAPGYSTPYAGWLTEKQVEELAFDDQTQPWVQASQKKYYLTKFYRVMQTTEMKDDLIFRQADDDTVVNAPEKSADKTRAFEIVMLSGSFLSVVLLVLIFFFLNKKETKPSNNKIKTNRQ